MADKVTNSSYLAVNFGFADGDTRLNKIPNPRSDLLASEVHTVSATLATNALIVGDKAGAAYTKILTADKYNIQKTELDLA